MVVSVQLHHFQIQQVQLQRFYLKINTKQFLKLGGRTKNYIVKFLLPIIFIFVNTFA